MMVDDVSMCSMRAHLKQLAELGHWSSILLKLTAQVYPPFETVTDGTCCIYVFNKSPLKTVSRIRSLLKFTPQVYCQSHLQVYCQSHLQVYCQSHLQVYPPIETVIEDRSHIGRYMSSVRAHSKLLQFTAQVYSSSSLLNFSSQVSHIEACTYTHGRWNPHAIDHTSMLHHYTQDISHTEECTYTHGRWTPPIDNRSMLHHYTQYVSHIAECTYTHGRCTPSN